MIEAAPALYCCRGRRGTRQDTVHGSGGIDLYSDVFPLNCLFRFLEAQSSVYEWKIPDKNNNVLSGVNDYKAYRHSLSLSSLLPAADPLNHLSLTHMHTHAHKHTQPHSSTDGG